MSQEQDEYGLVRVSQPIMTQTAPATADPQRQTATTKLEELEKRIASSGKNWFLIAGFSLINTVMNLCGEKISFMGAPAITQVVDALTKDMGGGAVAVAAIVGVIIAGVCVMLGYFSCRRARWALIAGMVLYALDTLICLIGFMVFSIAFHLCALYLFYRGLQADNEARQLEAQLKWAQIAPAESL